MERSGAEIIIEQLIAQGVETVAGMPGGANLPLYDALAASSLRHVLVRHEQAAGFIAQGIARVSGRAGVCLATSGPGATNLATALADARMDSVPLVAITGQVPTTLIGTDAFQEVDTCAMAAPLCKHVELVRRPEALAAAVARAFRVAESGRPGPVLLDVPKDVQVARVDYRRVELEPAPKAAAPSEASIDRALAELERSERPVLFLGGGVALSGAHALARELARRQQLPVACSLMGLGCADPESPLSLGMIGMHAAPFTNLALCESDLLFAVGVRFDDRATGKLSEFCPQARTVHVDIDARELGKLRALDLAVCSDARRFLEALLPRVPSRARAAWASRVLELKASEPLAVPAGRDPRRPVHLLQQVARRLDPDTVVTTDVGQHQMWAAQLLPMARPRQLLTSGGLGSMGFGLPAAIGAALAGAVRVLCISGDGSLLLNVQELATLAELDLDVTILLLDNRHLGLVRQQQALFYGERFSAARFERPTDFVALARALGVEAVSLPGDASAFAELDALLARRGPRLVHAPIEPTDHVLPMVPPGAANHHMLRAEAAAPPLCGSTASYLVGGAAHSPGDGRPMRPAQGE